MGGEGQATVSHIVLHLIPVPTPMRDPEGPGSKDGLEEDDDSLAPGFGSFGRPFDPSLGTQKIWDIGPKVVVFETASIQQLLPYQSPRTAGVATSTSEFQPSQMNFAAVGGRKGWSIDTAMASGPKAVAAYLRCVASLLRLERTRAGVRVFVAGATAIASEALRAAGESCDILPWDYVEPPNEVIKAGYCVKVRWRRYRRLLQRIFKPTFH